MNLHKVTNSWNAMMLRMADYGVPILMLRDPFTQRPSLPFTMMILAIILEVVSMVGNLSALVGGVDRGSAFQFLTTSAALYCGHSLVNSNSYPSPPPLPGSPPPTIKVDDPDDNGPNHPRP